MGLQIQVFNANTSREIDAAFDNLVRERPDVLFVSSGPFFRSRRLQLSQWANVTRSPLSLRDANMPKPAGSSVYGANLSMRIVRPAFTPVASSRARNLPTCQSCSQRSWSLSLMSRRPEF